MTTEKSYATIKNDGVVKCVAVGIPRPKFSWNWYEGDVSQTLSSEEGLVGRFKVKTEHYFENSTGYLMIKDVRIDDFRNYECRLKGGDRQIIHLVGYCKYFQQFMFLVENNAFIYFAKLLLKLASQALYYYSSLNLCKLQNKES
jgi:hypothetical protein